MAKKAIEEFFLPHFVTSEKTHTETLTEQPIDCLDRITEHPMDCLARIGLTGLQWFVHHSWCDGMWSPGQVLDIVQTIEKVGHLIKMRKCNVPDWDGIIIFLTESARKKLSVKFG